MRTFWLVCVVTALASAACGDVPDPYVIAGPTAPARVVTRLPLVWDSREELRDWAENAVTRGPITVEGDGTAAFIRIRFDSGDYVMRGPDFEPAASGVTGARIRARLRHDRARAPGSVQTDSLDLIFEVVNPPQPNTQPSMRVDVTPGDDWQELTLKPHIYCCVPPLTARYAYVPVRSTSPATMEIDRIELTR